VRESRSLGSVRGDRGNPVPYREQQPNIKRRENAPLKSAARFAPLFPEGFFTAI
jgi:hypothetical protein